ncbi:cyclic nucleotide-binding domain-containing protein [Nocardioides mangrovicus]|uniref:Cyclic nucleotide-binding domain-containing protein n=1 Tax=Nocardioides mangrovicus TaxID=2478913 RepID=A0A3L8NY46_9ACTN|nr:cyclic nucleotide-binding domain-containing protein [Nocardioides mangrovicus]RLV48136.1 cyclic nucleotide-binding domain-containing protein [Nocardioides mangrovicus]
MSSEKPALAQVPIFDTLSDAEVRAIAKAGTEVTAPANWSLISEKTPADKAYIILEGEVSVRHGKEEIARLGPGNIVGETAIVRHKLRNASVVTLAPTTALHFTREAVEKLVADIPTFREALESAASGRSGGGGGGGGGTAS